MAPQTRSRGQTAPAGRVYHSSPAPQQVRFPARRKSIRTYGRQSGGRASALKQQTLTQIDYLIPRSFEEPDPMDDDDGDDDAREEDDEEEKPRRAKRRKTEGDTSTPKSSFHTQTLTQLVPSWKTEDDDDDTRIVKDSEDESEDDANPEEFFGGLDCRGASTTKEEPRAERTPSVIPQTPANRRTRRDEIPPSQGSPFTPMLERYSPAPHRSPLQGKSPNIVGVSPSPSSRKMPGSAAKTPGVGSKRPRSLVIQDSFATIDHWSSTQDNVSVKATPTKKVPEDMLADLGGEPGTAEDQVTEKSEPSKPYKTPSPKKRVVKRSQSEIPDSDEEDGFYAGSNLDNHEQQDKVPDGEGEDDVDGTDEEAVYGRVGEETQFVMDQLATSSEQQTSTRTASERLVSSLRTSQIGQPSIPTSSPVTEKPARSRKQTVLQGNEDETDEIIPASHDSKLRSVRKADTRRQETPSRPSSRAATRSSPTHPRVQTQAYTQGFESQRIPLETIRAMAPQTNRSDIFISVRPEHVADIVAGGKNHEFRNYRIPQTVARIWIYTTRPDSTLRYMASISPAKQPGEIEDEQGLGNAEFNAGSGSSFAYELLQVYELNNPVGLAAIRENGWMDGPPQKYVYVPPAVVGQLMANLRCALFEDREGYDEDDEDDDGGNGASEETAGTSSQQDMTISQELAEQIRSDIVHSTQLPTHAGDGAPSSERSSLPDLVGRLRGRRAAKTPSQTPRRRSQARAAAAMRPSQATTASNVSTPTTSPAKTVARPQQSSSSLPAFPEDDHESPVEISDSVALDTSQLLTKSQMLPESLLRDEGRAPPSGWGSDGEDDEL